MIAMSVNWPIAVAIAGGILIGVLVWELFVAEPLRYENFALHRRLARTLRHQALVDNRRRWQQASDASLARLYETAPTTPNLYELVNEGRGEAPALDPWSRRAEARALSNQLPSLDQIVERNRARKLNGERGR